MVDFRMSMREMRGDAGNHYEKLGLKKISCASQFTIPDTAGMTADRSAITPIWGLPNPIREVKPLIAHIRSYPPHGSHLHPPISLFFVHNSNIITEHKVKLSLSISPCHDHELTPSTAYTEYSIHRVQHTPSTAYTEYSIHPVQHTPSPAYTQSSIHRVQHTPSTQDCLSSLHSHDHELTPEYAFGFRRAPLHDWPPLASSTWELKGRVTLSHSHSGKLTNWWIESQIPVRRPSTISKYSSKVAWSRPLRVSPISLDDGLQSRSILASKCISKPAQLRPPSESPNSLDYRLQVRTIMASECISSNSLNHNLQLYLHTRTITASTSASLNSHDHNLGLHLYVHSITTSKRIFKYARLPPPSASGTIVECISKFTRSRLPIVFPSRLEYRLQVHLQSCSITALECISEFTRLSFSGAPRIALKCRLQAIQIYRV